MLKEVRYLGILKAENIPKEALDIHKQNDQYRSFITSLDYTVDSYNKIIKTASPEEKPLIQNELDKIDADLEKGEKTLKWNSPSIGDYINDIRKKVSDLETRLQKSKFNIEKIQTLMNTWKDTSLFKRTENAKTTLLQLDDRQTRLDNRYKEIKETGQKIHDLVKVSLNFCRLLQLLSRVLFKKITFLRKTKLYSKLKMKILKIGRTILSILTKAC